MRFVRFTMVLAMGFVAFFITSTAEGPAGAISEVERAAGQRRSGAPPAGPAPQRGGEPEGGRGRGRGGGRGAVQSMTLVTTAWPDGGQIPLKYTQVEGEISPGVQWTNVPPGTASFVLVFRDLDAVMGQTTEPMLHWLLWNIPPTVTAIPQSRPDALQLEDGTRQISASGFRYRGPGASATGSMHHYVLEIYALDTMIDVQHAPQTPGGVNPAIATRDAVFQAMAGHVRGKGAYVGLFRRPQ